MKDSVKVEVDIVSDSSIVVGQRSIGEIILHSSERLETENIEYRLIKETRGLTRTIKEQIYGGFIAENLTLENGKRYVFPLEIVNSRYETYKGKNIEVIVRLEVDLRLKDERLIDHVISNFGFTAPSRLLSTSRIIQFKSEYSKNEVEDRSVELEIYSMFSQGVALIIFLIAFGAISMTQEVSQNIKILFLALSALVVIAFILYYLIGSKLVGLINAEFEDREGQRFQVGFKSSKNWNKVKKLGVRYKVLEEVIDDRGTTESKEVYCLYTSELKNISTPQKHARVDFDYPNQYYPRIDDEHAKIVWQLEVEVHIIRNLTYKFRQQISMK